MMTMLHSVWSGGGSAAGRRRSLLALGALLALVASVLIWASPQSNAQTPNIPPVAIAALGAATPNDNGTSNNPADDYVVQKLDGTRSFDPDGSIALYSWEVVTDSYKDWLAITQPNTARPSFIVPNEASVARYGQTIEFRLTVWDADPRTSVGALSDSDTVTYNFQGAETPTADITVTALLPNPDAIVGYDDDGDGMVDEDDEQFTVDAVVSRPGDDDNAGYEWHIMEGALLTLDGTGSSDPDSRLTDASFSWVRVYDSGDDSGVSDNAGSVPETLPGGNNADAGSSGVSGMKISSSNPPDKTGVLEALADRVVLPLANTNGTSPQPFYAYYRLTVTDEAANSDTADVLVVIHDQPMDPKAAVAVTVTDAAGNTTPAVQSIKELFGDNRYVVPQGSTVNFTATATDADGDTPTVSWDGAQVSTSDTTMATLMIPQTAAQGTEYQVNVTATDVTKRSSTTTVTIVAARNQAPDAVAPKSFPDVIMVGDGANGGDMDAFGLPTGEVTLRGIGFDADGDDIILNWSELSYQQLNDDGTLNTDALADYTNPANLATLAQISLPRVAYLSIDNSGQETASFMVPEVDSMNLPTTMVDHDTDSNTSDRHAYAIPIAFTVIDSLGVSNTGIVIVVIYDNEQYSTVANAGANQRVSGGSFVRLNGSGSRNSMGTAAGLLYSWAYTGIETDPRTENRSAITAAEVAGGYVEGTWFPYDGMGADGNQTDDEDPMTAGDQGQGAFHPTAGGMLMQANGRFPYFDAPSLHGFNSVKLTFTLTVTHDADGNGTADSGEDSNTAKVVITVSDGYYSGNITGPDFCTGFSLGGPQTFAFDSDGDGVADICSLMTTRRESVATQNALNELAALNPEIFRDHLHGRAAVADDTNTKDVDEAVTAIAGSCATAPTTLGDSQAALDADACGPGGSFTRRLSNPPAPVDPEIRDVFFSGAITSENFCTNRSLGGQPLYANDSDGDGVADICSLGYTRREAVARQTALEAAFLGHDQFAAALAQACAELGSTDFGDGAAALAADKCSRPGPGSTPGMPLPTPPAN